METKAAETRNAGTVTIPCAEYELLQAQSKRISALEKEVELLTEALRLSRHKRFGAASERASEEVMDQLSLLFNEAEVYADQAVEEDDGSVAVAAHKRHKKHEYTLNHLPENVPVEVVEHRLPEEERVCPECGSTLTEIGKEVRRRLKLEPAKLTVVEDWYYTYACRKCEQEGIETPGKLLYSRIKLCLVRSSMLLNTGAGDRYVDGIRIAVCRICGAHINFSQNWN